MLAALIDLILPRTCIGCGADAASLCSSCATTDPRTRDVAGLPVRCAARYDGAIRDALIAYKEHGRRDLARPLGRMLCTVLDSALDSDAVLVPVPSARRRRGGDHVVRLCRTTGAPLVAPLRLSREVADSAGLSREERRLNLDGAMAADPGEGRVVIVDDIVTSGASLTEAARALRAAGWRPIGAATVAWTPRLAGR